MLPPEVQNFAALDLWYAAFTGSVARVESLLAAGVDPNARFEDLPSRFSGVAEDWCSPEKNTHPPIFHLDLSQAPPLLCAAADVYTRGARVKSRQTLTRMTTALLYRGADPYALFRQPIHTFQGRGLFPEEPGVEEFDFEQADFSMAEMFTTELIRKELEFNDLRQQGKRIPAMEDSDYGTDEEYETATEYTPPYPRNYGVRSVIHALFEEALLISPVLSFLGDRDALDIQRRDPESRTLFLAACRSPLGLDASIEATFRSLRADTAAFDSPPERNTLLEWFVSRGADLLAVDKYARNALHQLFNCYHHEAASPPVIDAALKYLIKNCPSLVNQPDIAGFYPIQLAIRRMGLYWPRDNGTPTCRLDSAVDELLSGGADPFVLDAKSNTVLHYLAASLPVETEVLGDEQIRLIRVFLDKGVDAKTRNMDGSSALEIFLRTCQGSGNRSAGPENDTICKEVLEMFEGAGYNLTDTDTSGQTLLHQVARLDSYRAYSWFKALQDKRLDPMAKDKNGRTALDIARENPQWMRRFEREQSTKDQEA
ncbi:uncharacterized protein PFLUO_LOCUS6349 [Penicillium psychrofluorescens]|uniref:uncharacterized protein n=1 Tax=Penicillium psychrofluorescens TaxID=3158075 RepID=UPI003CCCC9D2